MIFVEDHRGIGAILKSSQLGAEITAIATQVARNVDGQHLVASSGSSQSGAAITGVVKSYTTDRVAASVTIQHPAGLAMQATHGVLTKAAAAAGLEVHQ